MIHEVKKRQNISVMVWAAFWRAKQSELYKLEQNFEIKKQSYSANFYIQVLKDNLLEIWEPDLIFMQNNALIHSAHRVCDWFTEMSIEVINWPSYLSDLNLIEHLWFRLKELIYEIRPDIETVSEGEDTVRAVLLKALQEAWSRITREYMNTLIRSMNSKVNAVIKAEE